MISQRVLDAIEKAFESVSEFQADEQALKEWVYEDIENGTVTIRLHGNPVYGVQMWDNSTEFNNISYYKVISKRLTEKGVNILTEGSKQELEISKGKYTEEDLNRIRKGAVICVKQTFSTTQLECGYRKDHIETLVMKYRGLKNVCL